MKVGDLVRYRRDRNGKRLAGRFAVVTRVYMHVHSTMPENSSWADMPMVTVHWNGLQGSMEHRQDMLELISENR